jgi:hypothetical protein
LYVEIVAPYTCRSRKLCTGLFHLRENSSHDVEFHLWNVRRWAELDASDALYEA